MDQDRPLLGILLMLGFCVLAPMGDAVAKLLGGRLPLAQIVFVRFAIQAALLAPVVLIGRRVPRMGLQLLGLVLLRTVMHVLGIGMMFSALVYLPLADAIAIAFVMPFILLLLGHYVMGEEVGWRRMAACAVGFAGTLMVVQPAFRDVGWPALLPLGVALNFALFMMVTRRISRRIGAVPLQAVSGLMATAMIAPLVLLVPAEAVPGLGWHPVGPGVWGLLVTIGLLGTLAHLLMTWSLRFAPGATLAPVQYLELPVATTIGYLVFGDLPGPLAGAGICVIVAAGLYILMRERAMHRAPSAVPAPARPAPPAAE
ncbi:DMT family transporter [Salipiger mucosus]|uniref:Membrane protein, putative n=1 Tax=Salipiger mucosus DSM 16094 TaxID=1123237 RepID=S9Q3S5_9RHOB|nr:DMT family transporter [Salipiger mucosus]EPX75976.1 Membrane protein, putative [Salipiger mucosus DSM 16094]